MYAYLTPEGNDFPIHPGQQVVVGIPFGIASVLSRVGQLDNVVVIDVHSPRGPTLVTVPGLAQQVRIARTFVHKSRTGCGTQNTGTSRREKILKRTNKEKKTLFQMGVLGGRY